MQYACVQVYITPTQSQEFSTPHSGEKEHQERSREPMVQQGRQEDIPDLRYGQRLPLFACRAWRVHQSGYIAAHTSKLLGFQSITQHTEVDGDGTGL